MLCKAQSHAKREGGKLFTSPEKLSNSLTTFETQELYIYFAGNQQNSQFTAEIALNPQRNL